MQARLQAAGVRPINNIVDVTNYVLLELGQPMHAFDLAALAGATDPRPNRARRRDDQTLDGQSRELTPDDAGHRRRATRRRVAGVMGGGDSEVTSATKTIVLESAYFNPRPFGGRARSSD